MEIIVTYDVPSMHVALKKALVGIGYQDHFFWPDNGVNKKVHLPNTTLYHKSKSPKDARQDVVNACNQLNIELERCIATQLGPEWSASWGKPFGT